MVNEPALEIELVDLADDAWNSLLGKALQGETFVDNDFLVPDMDLEPESPIDDSMDPALTLDDELISPDDASGASGTDDNLDVEGDSDIDNGGFASDFGTNDSGFLLEEIQEFEIPDSDGDNGSDISI